MKLNQTFFRVVFAGALITAGAARAEDTNDAINVLKQQIQELQQKVNALEQQRKTEPVPVSAEAKPKETARLSVGSNGLSISSADTNFVFQFHGQLQADNRTFFDDGGIAGNDSFLLRRAKPIFQGTVYRDFDFMFVPDFGGSTVQIVDAYINYRYRPWLQLRAGKYKPPVSLEQLQSDSFTAFNERALPTDLAPNRDVGFQLWGDVFDSRLSYAAGVFNGVGDARNSSNVDFESHREVVARLFLQPFHGTGTKPLEGLGFGVGSSWGNVSSNATGLPSTTGGTLPGFATDGQQQFFAYNPAIGTVAADGVHWRVAPQGYYYWGPVGLLGEYVISHQRVRNGAAAAELGHRAWQITAGWVLTGEDASYNAIVPKHPFDLSEGHWGAFQLVGRYGELDVDDAAFPVFANPATSASKAQSWSVGVNWYLNKCLRLNTSFSRTTFSGGGGAGTTPPATVTRQPEQVFFSRLQLIF